MSHAASALQRGPRELAHSGPFVVLTLYGESRTAAGGEAFGGCCMAEQRDGVKRKRAAAWHISFLAKAIVQKSRRYCIIKYNEVVLLKRDRKNCRE